MVLLGGISGEFGRAMVRILARPNEPDMPPKRTKEVLLRIYCTQIQPKIYRYGNKICFLLYRVARKEKNTGQQTLSNGAKSDEWKMILLWT